MQDRIPVNPGRVLITPEDGSAAFYATMVRSDNPTQEGTPLNKATLLKDATAAMYGLSGDAVPDDVLAFLGRYNCHWWSVLHGQEAYVSEYVESREDIGANEQVASYNNRTIYYSKTIHINQDNGSVSLVNPVGVSWTGSESSSKSLCQTLCELAPVYITNVHFDESSIFLIPSGATYGRYGGYTLNYDEESVFFDVGSSNPAYKIIGKLEIRKIEAGETTYVYSADRNAYPDSGTVDGLTYTYLGIPFDNAVTVPKVAVGIYLGTGTYGSSNPCSLTYDFVPLFVFVTEQATYGPKTILLVNGQTKTSYLGASSSSYGLTVSWNDNVVKWYADSSDGNAGSQLNIKGATYYHAAVGIRRIT